MTISRHKMIRSGI